MRVNHLDVARALCMVLVVFGHSDIAKHHQHLNAILASFRMPLFLIISGTFFQPQRHASEIFARKTDSLLKPYLTVALLYAPVYLLALGQGDALSYALGVLSFNGLAMPGWLFPMWFLTLLWALHNGGAWFVRLTRFAHLARGGQFIWIVGLLLVGSALIKYLWMRPISIGDASLRLTGLPFNLDLWPLAAAFFLTGHTLKKEIRTMQPTWQLIVAAALLFALTHMLYMPDVSLLERRYPDTLANTVEAFSGAFVLIGLAHFIARSPLATAGLVPLGRLSLYILIFHAPVLSLSSKVLQTIWFMHPMAAEWLAILVSLAVSVALGKVIEMTPLLRPFFEPFKPAAHTAARTGRLPSKEVADMPAATSLSFTPVEGIPSREAA